MSLREIRISTSKPASVYRRGGDHTKRGLRTSICNDVAFFFNRSLVRILPSRVRKRRDMQPIVMTKNCDLNKKPTRL